MSDAKLCDICHEVGASRFQIVAFDHADGESASIEIDLCDKKDAKHKLAIGDFITRGRPHLRSVAKRASSRRHLTKDEVEASFRETDPLAKEA